MAAVNGREWEAGGDGAGGAPKLHQAAAIGRHGLLGLAAASTAITLAVIEPPAWFDRNAYSVSVSGLFFAGMAQVIASVWAAADHRLAAGRELVNVMRSSLGFKMVTGSGGNGGELEAARGAPKLLYHQAAFGHALFGLAAVSTVINLAVIEPPPCVDRNAYFVPLSGMFFAGMTQVIASVWVSNGGCDRVVGTRKLVNVMSYASLAVAAGLTAASLLL